MPEQGCAFVSEGPHADHPTLAVVVIARDEEHNIAECLRSAPWADCWCVLLDSRTEDRTAQIAREAGAEVRVRKFDNFAAQRNAALELFDAEWVFFVDADERATSRLGREIRRVVREEAAVGWWVPRRNYIWGRWIRHAGWYPDYQLRLLKRGHACYEPEREVHEVVQLTGPEGYLENTLTHYNYATVEEFLRRQDEYAAYEASMLVRGGARPGLHSVVVQPLCEFWRRYVSLRGYRDGAHGLLLSLLTGYYAGVAHWRARHLVRTDEDRGAV